MLIPAYTSSLWYPAVFRLNVSCMKASYSLYFQKFLMIEMEFNFVYQNSRVIAMESKPMPQVSSMNAVTEISCC